LLKKALEPNPPNSDRPRAKLRKIKILRNIISFDSRNVKFTTRKAPEPGPKTVQGQKGKLSKHTITGCGGAVKIFFAPKIRG
jgi:hypothetical protein